MFDSFKHDHSELYISAFDGVKRAYSQMNWLLKRGNNLAANKSSHAKVNFIAQFWPSDKRETKLTLYSSEEDKAPKRRNSTVSI